MNAVTRSNKCERGRGQALVEFSLSIIVFLVMIMGIFDLGRAIFAYNGVSEAARDIARRTAVYPYDATFEDNDDLGSSSQVQATIDTQMHLVPGMVRPEIGSPDFVCVDIDGALSTNSKCSIGDYKDYVRVTVSATYEPITPLVGVFGPITITASSTASFPKTDVS